jgi:putative MATE family efflux protein
VVNVAAAFVLVFGYLGFPALGVAGAAWAAVVARALGVGFILWRLAVGGRAPGIGRGDWHPDPAVMLRVVRVGGPAAIEQLVVQIGLMFFSMVSVRIGTAAFAAQQIVFNAAQLSQLPGMAFSVAATTAVGQSLGAGNVRRASLAGWLAFASAAVWMSLLGLTYALFGETWLRLYSDDVAVVSIGVSVMGMLALCQPIQAAAYVLSGALRGAGDTRTTMWGGLLGTCFVRVPVAFLLGLQLGLGLYGVWIGWFADWAVRATIYTLRFRSGRWSTSRL